MITVREFDKANVTVLQAGSNFTREDVHLLLDLIRSVAAAGVSTVVVDLGSTTSVDNLTISALVNGAKHVQHCNGHLALIGLSPEVQRVVQSMRLNQIFNVYDNLETAIEALSNGLAPLRQFSSVK
jgi:anti-anti-sigma factor